MDKKITGIVAYIGLIGWLIAFFIGDREGAKRHLNQALVLALAELIAGVAASILVWIPILGWILCALLGLVGVAAFVLAIIGIYNAIVDNDQPLPIIGGITLLK